MSKTADLLKKLDEARALGVENETFRHYKGGIYYVTDLVIDTDDGNVRVQYIREGGPDYDPIAEAGIVFVRPLAEFFDEVAVIEDGVPVKKPRFQKVRQVIMWEPVENEDEMA